MKVLSIFFSGTNNTKYIADEIANKLNKVDGNITIDSVNITNVTCEANIEIEKYDMYIIGGPVYVEVLPHRLMEFVKRNFIKSNNKRVVLYSTAASNTPPALYGLNKYLINKGFQIDVCVNFTSYNNYYMSGRFPYTKIEEREKIIKNISDKIDEVVDVILNKEKSYIEQGTLNKSRYYTGAIVYSMIKNSFIKKYALKNFNSSLKCTGCGKCEIECPSNNISVNKVDKNISFSKKCYACTRCIHICPFKAIQYKGKDIKKYNSEFIN